MTVDKKVQEKNRAAYTIESIDNQWECKQLVQVTANAATKVIGEEFDPIRLERLNGGDAARVGEKSVNKKKTGMEQK